MAFIRTKLLEAIVDHVKLTDAICSVNIKEAITGDNGSVTLEQRKQTFFPDWNRCFDSHLKPGRRMQIIVNDRIDAALRPLAEVTVEIEALATECMAEEEGDPVKLAVSQSTSRERRTVSYRNHGRSSWACTRGCTP